MRLGAIYPGLMAAIRQEELLGEARRRQRSTVPTRHRGQSLTSRIRQALAPTER
jgi:hypothetical protein